MDEEVGESLFRAAPYSASDVVQLGEAESVRVVDDEGVYVGHVDARFDDGGADEDVVLAAIECGDHFLELSFGHLTVPDGE